MCEPRPLRVGYVLKRFPRLSETFVLNEILGLERAGAHVEVFSLRPPGDEPRHEILGELRAPVHDLVLRENDDPSGDAPPHWQRRWQASLAVETDRHPVWAGKSAQRVRRLRNQAGWVARLAGELGLSHLHAHFGSDATTVAMLAARGARLRFSYTAHARDIYHCYVDETVDRLARRHKLEQAEFTATVSESNRTYLETLARGIPADVRLLYNGIDLNRFAPTAEAVDNGAHIVAIGRLVAKKGFDHLVTACALLAARGLPFTCDIVGDGPLRATLEQQVRDCGLSDRVRLRGAMTQARVIETLRRATVTTLPCVVDSDGDRDALPTVLLESLAMAIPVVTTTVNGCPEIVGDDEAGWLVPPGDAVALAGALSDALTRPHERLRRGLMARRRCERRFDLQRNTRLLAAWLRDAACKPDRELQRMPS
jgi:glycosyltransferase involved in cell wall biosynthesis